MERLSTLFTAALLTIASAAQTNDLIVYTDDAVKFTLLVDGDQKNQAPDTRVVATGIRTATPRVIVRFADASIPQLSKALYLEPNLEYTMVITTNKKGEKVLRPTGQAPLGTASNPAPQVPADFVEDAPTGSVQPSSEPVPNHVTTTTIVQEVGGSNDPTGVHMDVAVPGFNMNVNVHDGIGSSTTTTTTTTTHTTSTSVPPNQDPNLIIDRMPKDPEPEVYIMPGYTGRIGCGWPMTDAEFADVKKSLESKGFEETKMTMAKQVGSNRCFTVDQVKGMMGIFSFEDSKLDFAKYAYERTYDIDNYFKVNDAFSFESSIDELNEYIMAR